MADKNMNDSPNLPGTGQTAAKDRTGQGYSARADSRTLRVNCTPVEADPTRHGALGKTDVNLGQDTPSTPEQKVSTLMISTMRKQRRDRYTKNVMGTVGTIDFDLHFRP